MFFHGDEGVVMHQIGQVLTGDPERRHDVVSRHVDAVELVESSKNHVKAAQSRFYINTTNERMTIAVVECSRIW